MVPGGAAIEIKSSSQKSSEEGIVDIMGKEETRTSGTQLINLPFDVLRYIHERLNLIDYMRFRSVSRLCREVSPALDIKSAIVRLEVQSNSLAPWLMSFRENGQIIKFTHPQSVDRYSIEAPEVLEGVTNVYCKDGWLLVGKQRGENFLLSFFNPFTESVISYEEIPKCKGVRRIGFSRPPTCQNCVIVVLVTLENNTLGVHICHSTANSWRMFEFQRRHFWPGDNNPVFSNGKFYFQGRDEELGVLSMQAEGCDWKIIEHRQEFSPYYDQVFLAEHDGEVFKVSTYEWEIRNKTVLLHKFDPSAKRWKRIMNLGNYNLHVSKSSAIFTVAKTRQAENIIYFPNCYKRDSLVSYSMSTDSYESSRSAYVWNFTAASRRPFHCVWIKPTCS